MKTKITHTVAILLIFLSFHSMGQTYVNGGVYANTTWYSANSPYIVTDMVVVFPGVTLTIQPGVTVKFNDSTGLEIRQAILSAEGTTTDSITFTSSSTNPHAGIWNGVIIGTGSGDTSKATISYCNFRYGGGNIFYPEKCALFINNYNISTDIKHCFFSENVCAINSIGKHTNMIDSCSFINNEYGVNDQGGMSGTIITNSIFNNNQTGVLSINKLENCFFCNNVIAVYGADTIINCNFSQNHQGFINLFRKMTGCIFSDNDTAIFCAIGTSDTMINNYIFHNYIGILLSSNYNTTSVYNNKICNNTLYNIKYTQTPNNALPNNCWCTNDSASIAGKIYDGYDNVSLGLITFTPFLTCDSTAININNNACNQGGNNAIPEIEKGNTVTIYPNPNNGKFTIEIDNKRLEPGNINLEIYNMLGEKIYSTSNFTQQTSKEIDLSNNPKGINFVKIFDRSEIYTGKIVIQ